MEREGFGPASMIMKVLCQTLFWVQFFDTLFVSGVYLVLIMMLGKNCLCNQMHWLAVLTGSARVACFVLGFVLHIFYANTRSTQLEWQTSSDRGRCYELDVRDRWI